MPSSGLELCHDSKDCDDWLLCFFTLASIEGRQGNLPLRLATLDLLQLRDLGVPSLNHFLQWLEGDSRDMDDPGIPDCVSEWAQGF